MFIGEQGVDAPEEFDEYEAEAIQVVGLDGDTVVATCRLRMVDGDLKLERMCVERELRGSGVGTVLLAEAERVARELGVERMIMHAQTRARGFYAANGYEPEGELFMEAGIEHIRMAKPMTGTAAA